MKAEILLYISSSSLSWDLQPSTLQGQEAIPGRWEKEDEFKVKLT